HKNGTPIEVSATISPLRNDTGEIVGASKIVRDITERKQAEMQLRLTNEKLVRATRLKDEFLANMSHELRTPLNAILGMAESLQEQVFGEIHQQQVKPLDMIRRSGHHLLELINDILDVAKIESGQIELDVTLSAVEPICQESLTFIMQQAYQKSIQIETNLPTHLPNVHVDKLRMRQVLINLLSNAVKFTPKGGRVRLDVSLQNYPKQNRADINAFVRIAISDTGIGIASEHISNLFEPFIQIDSDLNRKYSGTGLGLALVKRIVELHGGVVEVTSKLGNGSCFTVDLPCTLASPFPPAIPLRALSKPEANQTQFMGASLILLAENEDANSITIMSYLRAKGYCVQIAANCQGVIDLAQSALPDLILIDSHLPGIDALDTIRQIRCISNLTDIPIITLAASDIKNHPDQYPTLGTYRYLSKPFKVKTLIDAIQQLLQEGIK
ncbi:response regulator, partial [Leptolyngbya cf. ectocarpi LEGE 11479]